MPPAVIHDLDELKRRLAPHLRGARKAIVFGSVARGSADEWSDLDLVIVADTQRPFLKRYLDFEGIYDVWPVSICLSIRRTSSWRCSDRDGRSSSTFSRKAS